MILSRLYGLSFRVSEGPNVQEVYYDNISVKLLACQVESKNDTFKGLRPLLSRFRGPNVQEVYYDNISVKLLTFQLELKNDTFKAVCAFHSCFRVFKYRDCTMTTVQ